MSRDVTLSYYDPETAERVDLDISGWQFVIDTSNGELCRVDFVQLALLVKMGTLAAPTFSHSLLRPPGGVLGNPQEWWLDVLVEKR